MMTRPEVRWNGPADAPLTVVLAHGAGAPMDSPFLEFFATALSGRAWRIGRFEFPYMARRRTDGGRKRPPDAAPVLLATWRAVIGELDRDRLVIGGKSMGGRMASMVADAEGVRGLVCLGYPFHPPAAPDRPRTAHLAEIRTPTLILQGTRDPFGGVDEVAAYRLSRAIRLQWLADADHSFVPRVASGRTQEQTLTEAVAAADDFLQALLRAATSGSPDTHDRLPDPPRPE